MSAVLASIIAAVSAVAVALIGAGVIGQTRQTKRHVDEQAELLEKVADMAVDHSRIVAELAGEEAKCLRRLTSMERRLRECEKRLDG